MDLVDSHRFQENTISPWEYTRSFFFNNTEIIADAGGIKNSMETTVNQNIIVSMSYDFYLPAFKTLIEVYRLIARYFRQN